MKKNILSITISLSLAFTTLVRAERDIDLIMINGQIKTPSAWVEAIAIDDGIIKALGDSKTINAMAGKNTEVIRLQGATVLPGLHDMHVHPLFAGIEQYSCVLKHGASPAEIAASVKGCAEELQPGEWLLGGNWVGAVFKPGQQNKEFLDDLAPDNPVVLTDEAHHSLWINSMALQLAGITDDTPNPAGGIIERDSSGEANGLLRETAAGLVQRLVPPPSEQRKRDAIILASNQMLSFGITSYLSATVRSHNIGTLSALSKQGLVKQRVRGCIVWVPGIDGSPVMGEELIEIRHTYTQERFSPDCVKVFIDGVPTESHTAAMLEPYADTDRPGSHNRPEKGLLLIPQNVLNKAVTDFDRQGLHIKFHAAGNAAVRSAIDAVAKAREMNGMGGAMHHVGHNSFVDMADIPRVRDLQMSWEFSPYIWYPTPITADIEAAVGKQLMKRFIPIKDAVDTGALVVVGSDWSVIPSVNPWLAIETMVTRKQSGAGKQSLNKQQAISLEQAFRILTHNGARLMGHSDQVGSIEVGMQADIIVTERNPFEVPITEVHSTKVKMTFIEGEKVFDANSPPRLSAE